MRRAVILFAACMILWSRLAAQDSTIYSFNDPLVTEHYIFYFDHTFKHYSQSLGKFYCGRGTWEEERGIRIASFGLRDTTMTAADAEWSLLDMTGVFSQALDHEASPSQHFFKVKKDKLVFSDYHYSIWERLRGEKPGWLERRR
jgi:hypothetical protein